VWKSQRREHDARCDEVRPVDARLVEGLRRGAPEAFAGLHEEYAAGIYNLALRVVRHAPDAEDITQDVLLRAFERLPRDREVLLRPWLYRLTLNRCYDHLRWAARRPFAPAELDAPSPHDPYEQSELQRLLEASLADLTRRQRAALLLKDVHGLSLVEVAACLDVTPGSVEVLLARARRAFRASFEKRSAAAGRPVPGSVLGLGALLVLPLPAGLAVLPSLPLGASPAPVPPAAVFSPPPAAGLPIGAATGGGIGALLGLPASVKTAVLIAAAAATVGTAEVAATHTGHRPPHRSSGVAKVASRSAVEAAPVGTAARRTASPPSSRPPGRSSAARSTAPEPSVSPTEVAEPSPTDSPLGVSTPTATPVASATPTPEDSPTGRATADPAPTVSSSPSPTASPTVSPEPISSPSASTTP